MNRPEYHILLLFGVQKIVNTHGVGGLIRKLMNFLVASGVRQAPETEGQRMEAEAPAETDTNEGSTND